MHWLLKFLCVFEFMRIVHPRDDFGTCPFGLLEFNCMGLLSIGSLGIFIWGFGFFILQDIGCLGLNSLRALGSLASSDLISRFKFEY